MADPEPLRKSLAARTTLTDGDHLAAGDWLRGMGLVREGVERLAGSGARRALHSDAVPRDLVVLQLPHATGDRWLALPFGGRRPASWPRRALQWRVDFGAPLSGLFGDAWTETIPAGRRRPASRSITTPRVPGPRRPSCSPSHPPPTHPAWSV